MGRGEVLAGVSIAAACVAIACSGGGGAAGTGDGLHKIDHIIMIVQENRSFDSYFGTFPGADGFPYDDNGEFTVCSPDPASGVCEKPFHDPKDANFGARHQTADAIADINGGKMDGFVRQAREVRPCENVHDPNCSFPGVPDVMGYHDAREIPNYWAYAENFVLQDAMFEPAMAWSLPAHLFLVSGWSARCPAHDAMTCVNEGSTPPVPPDFSKSPKPDPIYAWTDLTHLLYEAGVSWAYYIVEGTEPDCRDAEAECVPRAQDAATPGIWNPLPYFDTVRDNGQLGNIRSVERFFDAARTGDLPAVSWVVPSQPVSEHPPALVSDGQAFVTSLVNAVMSGPDWESSAIFITWDDWGGFYDHVNPPQVDENGYGLRVPGMLVSPYARRGMIDHQTLSFDAYLKLIEDRFLGGARIDPTTDGRPDRRPTVRENVELLGDLRKEFDFSQQPLPPMLLPLYPDPGPASVVGAGRSEGSAATTTTTRSTRACAPGHWPARVVGQPDALLEEDPPEGAYLWYDFLGWHLRVVGDHAGARVAGSFVSATRIPFARSVPAEAVDTVSVVANVVHFDLPLDGTVRGFNANEGCGATTVRLDLALPGDLFPTNTVRLGKDGVAAGTAVLTFEREK